ncbi:MAG: PGPGW domain-containing protein [Spirochaetales bacterium]|nr:PGPGW domain-containing protein [Spirochaetales bacterium]
MIESLISLFHAYRLPLIIIGGSSIFLFIATPIIIPLVIRFMTEDYFIRDGGKAVSRIKLMKILYIFWHIIKNIFGLTFVLAGIILLFVPGQGILTIMAGLILLDFPGKHRLIGWLTRGEKIRQALNWMRMKTRQSLFIFPSNEEEKTAGGDKFEKDI